LKGYKGIFNSGFKNLTHLVLEMINKSNEATPQRPQGDRMLNAPLVEIDLNKFITQIKKETTWAESDHNSITLFKSERLRIVLLGLHKNAELKTHAVNGTISVQVLQGKISFTTEQQTVVLEKGQMIALQPRIPHSVLAIKESFFLLTIAMN
jgi:quercetin dioxygenase-like cupin family protein